MSPIVSWSFAGALSTIVLFGGLNGIAIHPVASAETAGSYSCGVAQYRDFDFWIGDWDAFDFDDPNTTVAYTRVDRILDGCVLLEEYKGATGLEGRSFSIYDASRKTWHQTWVTNRGRLLQLDGARKGDEMVLTGVDQTADGKEREVRGSWKPINRGFRETAVTSTDGGKTWEPWFDLAFRPRAKASK